MILQTDRLILRKMDDTDFEALCKILQDPQVMYAYEHAFSDAEVQDWLDRQLERYQVDGFGLWAVVLKETGEMIGQCGLTMQMVENEQVVEIGYLLQRSFWHQGYAIEAALACKAYAFHTLKLPKVHSIIRDNNIASQKVALKNGMKVVTTIVKHYYGMDMPHLVYCAENTVR